MKEGHNIYSSAISTEKKEDFLIFLQQIGISEDEVEFDENHGNCILYTIDLSEKEHFEINQIRNELVNTLTDFL